MRQMALDQRLSAEDLQQLADGRRLQLVVDEVAVAEIIPIDRAALHEAAEAESRRRKAGEELMAILRKGYDLGGLRIESRGELYE